MGVGAGPAGLILVGPLLGWLYSYNILLCVYMQVYSCVHDQQSYTFSSLMYSYLNLITLIVCNIPSYYFLNNHHPCVLSWWSTIHIELDHFHSMPLKLSPIYLENLNKKIIVHRCTCSWSWFSNTHCSTCIGSCVKIKNYLLIKYVWPCSVIARL